MLKTAMILGSKMVLQRNKKIPVWGTGKPGRTVNVSFDGQEKHTVVDNEGNWKVMLDPHEAGSGYSMLIYSFGEEIFLTDICVGEVWLAGGQSNMEYLLGFEEHFDDILKKQPKNPNIRFFDYPEVAYEGALEDFNYKYEGFWRKCTNADLPFFSAAGYYFAENLQAALNVPIGIVGCNWGGTPACAWMDPERLKGTEGEVWVKEYEDALTLLEDVEAYKAAFPKDPANDRTNEYYNPDRVEMVKEGTTRERQMELMESWKDNPPLVVGPYYERRPGGLYETMLKKVWPFPIKGVIWYQGETDADFHPHEYTTVFSKMIENWRDLWEEKFPFLFVQLAPFYRWLACEGTNYPIVRACQEQVAATVKNTWMASSSDAGMEWDIHPKNKLVIGERLALLARGHVYGEAILSGAPEVMSAEKHGDRIEIIFRNGQDLHIKGDQLNALTGIDKAGNPTPLTKARAFSDTLVVYGCKDIVKLEFAAGEYYEVNLYNEADIPAIPFIKEIS